MNANHLSQARNVRFYVLIVNDAAMLTLNVGCSLGVQNRTNQAL